MPIIKREITGRSIHQGMYYEPGMTKEEGDEVEDLYALVKTAKEAFPEI